MPHFRGIECLYRSEERPDLEVGYEITLKDIIYSCHLALQDGGTITNGQMIALVEGLAGLMKQKQDEVSSASPALLTAIETWILEINESLLPM